MLTDTIYSVIQKDNTGMRVVDANYSMDNALRSLQETETTFMNIPIANWQIHAISPGLEELLLDGKADIHNADVFETLKDKNGNITTLQIVKVHIYDTEDESRKWHFDYQQEFPESQWGNLMGTIRNNQGNCLFYAVGSDDEGEWTTLKLFHSIDFNEDTLLVTYPWTDENDQLLIEALNSHTFEEILDEKILTTLPFKEK